MEVICEKSFSLKNFEFRHTFKLYLISLFWDSCLCMRACGRSPARWLNQLAKIVSLYQSLRNLVTYEKCPRISNALLDCNFSWSLRLCNAEELIFGQKRFLDFQHWTVRLLCYLYFLPMVFGPIGNSFPHKWQVESESHGSILGGCASCIYLSRKKILVFCLPSHFTHKD